MTLPLGKNLSIHLTLVAVKSLDRQDHGVTDLKVAVLILISIGAHADSAIRQGAKNSAGILAGDHSLTPAVDRMTPLCPFKGIGQCRLHGNPEPILIGIIVSHNSVQFLPGTVDSAQIRHGHIAEILLR